MIPFQTRGIFHGYECGGVKTHVELLHYVT